MQQKRVIKHPRQQMGAGMVEVLIALLISAVGLLGLGGLQASSLRYQKTANFRGLATQYASEMADRLRANLVGARDGHYNDFASGSYTGNAPTAPSSMPCNGSDFLACTPQQVALQDVYRWRLGLSQGLAGGYGEISGDASKGFVIRVYYKEPASRDSTIDPNCRSGATLAPEVRCAVTVFIP